MDSSLRNAVPLLRRLMAFSEFNVHVFAKLSLEKSIFRIAVVLWQVKHLISHYILSLFLPSLKEYTTNKELKSLLMG